MGRGYDKIRKLGNLPTARTFQRLNKTHDVEGEASHPPGRSIHGPESDSEISRWRQIPWSISISGHRVMKPRKVDLRDGPVCGEDNCRSTRYYDADGFTFCKKGHQQEVFMNTAAPLRERHPNHVHLGGTNPARGRWLGDARSQNTT